MNLNKKKDTWKKSYPIKDVHGGWWMGEYCKKLRRSNFQLLLLLLLCRWKLEEDGFSGYDEQRSTLYHRIMYNVHCTVYKISMS